MKTVNGAQITLKNVLYLTDFSEPSEAALPFALAIAREYGARIHALHVQTPDPYLYTYTMPETIAAVLEAQDQKAQFDMQALEAQLDGVPHEVNFVNGTNVWEPVEQAIAGCAADLIVLGTHGRTGAEKLLMGSVAEEIFRRSPIPVLTIGPWARKGRHNGAHFHRVLFPTDFTAQSLAALPYAVSIAEKSRARLTLLHVIPGPEPQNETAAALISRVGISHELRKLVLHNAQLSCHPERILEHGDPAEQILRAAKEHDSDLIVLGVRSAGSHLGAATHLGRTIAHKIVAHAACPVLTVRG